MCVPSLATTMPRVGHLAKFRKDQHIPHLDRTSSSMDFEYDSGDSMPPMEDIVSYICPDCRTDKICEYSRN